MLPTRNCVTYRNLIPFDEQATLPHSRVNDGVPKRPAMSESEDSWPHDQSPFTIRPIGQTTAVSPAPEVIKPTAAYGRPAISCDGGRRPDVVNAIDNVAPQPDSSCFGRSKLSAWKPLVHTVSKMEPPIAVQESPKEDDAMFQFCGKGDYYATKEARGGESIRFKTHGTIQRRGTIYNHDLITDSEGAPFDLHDDLLNTGDIVQCKPAVAYISPDDKCQWRSESSNLDPSAFRNRRIPIQAGSANITRNHELHGPSELKGYVSEPRPETYGRASTPQHTPACLSSVSGTRRDPTHGINSVTRLSRSASVEKKDRFMISHRNFGLTQQPSQESYCFPRPLTIQCVHSGNALRSLVFTDETFSSSSSSHSFSYWLRAHSSLILVTCLKHDYRPEKVLSGSSWNIEQLQTVINERCPPPHAALPTPQLHQLNNQLELVLLHVAAVIRLLSRRIPVCNGRVVLFSAQMALSAAVGSGCVTACHTAAQLYGGRQLHTARGARAKLRLNVGGFHRWLAENLPRCLIHELASVYLAAVIEHVLETMIKSWLSHTRQSPNRIDVLPAPNDPDAPVSCQICQPCNSKKFRQASETEKILQQKCVRDNIELRQNIELATRFLLNTASGQTTKRPVTWSRDAVDTLTYFMTCPQTGCKHSSDDSRNTHSMNLDSGFRDLTTRPSLAVWLRVCLLMVEFRQESEVLEDHIVQAAKLLLPSAQCPPPVWRLSDFTSASISRRACIDVVFGAVLSGSPSLMSSALQYASDQCGGRPVDTMCASGMTPLMAASLLGHSSLVSLLISHTAVVNCPTPATNSAPYTAVLPECQGWTALTYATTSGDLDSVKILLENGADVEAGCTPDTPRITPLQIAVGLGDERMILLLLSHGADPLLSTSVSESPTQSGCYAPVVIAAARGDTQTLLQLLCRAKTKTTQTFSLQEALNDIDRDTCPVPNNKLQKEQRCDSEVDSASIQYRSAACDVFSAACTAVKRLDKSQIRILQESAYHAAEAGFHDTVVCLSNLDVPWIFHTWLTLLEQVFSAQRRHLVARLLKRFAGKCWVEKESQRIADRCVPMLFDVLRYRWSDEISWLAAAVISTCYNHSSHQSRHASPRTASTTPSSTLTTPGSTLTTPSSTSATPTHLTTPTFHPVNTSDAAIACSDPPFYEDVNTPTCHLLATPTSVSSLIPPAPTHFVAADYFNNAELSDVVFHVQGRQMFGHRLLLVNSSPHFRRLLSNDQQTTPLHIHIDHVRYSVFELLLKHVYISDWCAIYVGKHDLLELLSAAYVFQIQSLLEYIQFKCAAIVDATNVASMYKCALSCGANYLLVECQCFILSKLPQLIRFAEFDRFVFNVQSGGHNVVDCLQQRLQYCLQQCHRHDGAA